MADSKLSLVELPDPVVAQIGGGVGASRRNSHSLGIAIAQNSVRESNVTLVTEPLI